ncbi:MAG: winged helix DNA-binding protein [Nitrososphaerales archaeon]
MLLDTESVLIITLVFILGLASIFVFNRLKSPGNASMPHLVAEYTRRLREYEDMLVDLKIRLDTLQIRNSISDVMPPVSQEASDTGHMPRTLRKSQEQEGVGMADYVLKMLFEGAKTSRQIERIIGRSREHTARLMKKLFEMGYVSRDMTSKPYTYTITDAGKTILSPQVASINSNA